MKQFFKKKIAKTIQKLAKGKKEPTPTPNELLFELIYPSSEQADSWDSRVE